MNAGGRRRVQSEIASDHRARLPSRLMKMPQLRSPHDKVGGIVHFGRMIDKIRAHAVSPLGPDYEPTMGKGFDGRVCHFLKISYHDLRDHVLAQTDGPAEAMLDWAFAHGRRPDDEEIFNFNEFMRKYGWNDEATDRLKFRKESSELGHRDDIVTMFQYIDADEGRG
jgi:Domain of unknown function (DUF5069)